jgi:hypothetical protein
VTRSVLEFYWHLSLGNERNEIVICTANKKGKRDHLFNEIYSVDEGITRIVLAMDCC